MSKKALSKRARAEQAITISKDPDKPIRQQPGGVKPKPKAKAKDQPQEPYRTSSYDHDPCRTCNCFTCGRQVKGVVCVECPEGNDRIEDRWLGCTGCPKQVKARAIPKTTLGDLLFAAIAAKGE